MRIGNLNFICMYLCSYALASTRFDEYEIRQKNIIIWVYDILIWVTKREVGTE